MAGMDWNWNGLLRGLGLNLANQWRMKMVESKKSRERNFQVMMYALSEEKRVCGMDSAEYARRYREAFDSCFGADEKQSS